MTGVLVVVAVLVAASLPWWLPARVVALRARVFALVNGQAAITVPGELIGHERFEEIYSHPAARGRSRGAALSDLFWYWLSPGAHLHQEHLEDGERYDAVAAATRAYLALPRTRVEELARACAARGLTEGGLVRLRDLMMPIWAEFAYELVFAEPCPPEARRLIVGNADDVVTALKCCGLRHLARRDRLTRYLLARLDRARLPLPAVLSREEQALYLQGVFFNTAVVQLSEAMAHLLLVLAQHPGEADLDAVMAETMRVYPLFGVAHRITTGDIALDERTTIPAGTVLCFNYPDYHRPHEFDAARSRRDVPAIPFGVAANRPCPAWRLAPIAMRVVALETLERFELRSSAAHTRSLPNRGPCLLTPRGAPAPRAPALLAMRLRDRWEDLWRSLVQLVLGTYMVWDARRQRLCERHFAG
ncbi:MAG: cytochrome P450 [Nonomuraea sp.]|nr:cytochrome P450 [Nonomuraea sp.]